MRKKIREFPVLLGIILLLLVLLLEGTRTGSVLAQETEDEDKREPVNWAFATHLGTGIYTASGRAVQVYTLPFSHGFRDAKEYNWGLKVKFPVTLGFYDFELKDIIESGIPSDVTTLSILPGLELEFPIRENWSLMPFADLGAGYNFSADWVTYIYSAGIKSLVIFPWQVFECRFGNKLLFAGFNTPEASVSDSFWSFETGLDLRHPLWFTVRGHPMNWSVYFVNYLYANLEFLRFLSDDFNIDVQNEFGVTVGTSDKFWWSGNPRLGLGYRFGPDFYAIRIVFGMPF
jgi:hypothetical protein